VVNTGTIPLQTEQTVEVQGLACENCLIDLTCHASRWAHCAMKIETTSDGSLFALVPHGRSTYVALEIEAEMRETIEFCVNGHHGPH
jgi:hypothetical protein